MDVHVVRARVAAVAVVREARDRRGAVDSHFHVAAAPSDGVAEDVSGLQHEVRLLARLAGLRARASHGAPAGVVSSKDPAGRGDDADVPREPGDAAAAMWIFRTKTGAF